MADIVFTKSEWAHTLGKLTREQKAGAELVKLLNELDALAHKLYKLSLSDGVVSSLRGQLEAYARVISNVGVELTGQIM